MKDRPADAETESGNGDESFDLLESLTFATDRGGWACPFCAHRSWLIETPEGEAIAPGLAQKPPTGIFQYGPLTFAGPPLMPTIAFTCRKYGFVRQHNLAWIKERLRKGDVVD